MNIVKVAFSRSDTRAYDYLVPSDWPVEVGDNLVVMGVDGNLKVVGVREIDVPRRLEMHMYRRAVSHFHTGDWEDWEAGRIEEAELRSAINARVASLRAHVTTAQLATLDAELARLVETLATYTSAAEAAAAVLDARGAVAPTPVSDATHMSFDEMASSHGAGMRRGEISTIGAGRTTTDSSVFIRELEAATASVTRADGWF